MKLLVCSLVFWAVFGFGNSFSQEAVVCFSCGQNITSTYLTVEGKFFHPEHFVCGKCGKPITEGYKKKGETFLHADCYAIEEGLICNSCGKVITENYISASGKPYHSACYNNNVALRCAVCGEPLLGTYTTNIYNDAYHPQHANELEKCDNCGRLICPRLTHGGQKLSDGRAICNICYSKGLLSDSEREQLLTKVCTRLRGFNLALRRDAIAIRAVDRNKLIQFYDRQGPIDELRGFCKSESQESYINNKLDKTITHHTIYVLEGLPSIDLEGIIAHELMHAWIYENAKRTSALATIEGSCNYISWLYLRSTGDPESRFIIKRMEENTDQVYGKGFRDIKSRFEGKPIEELLKFLK